MLSENNKKLVKGEKLQATETVIAVEIGRQELAIAMAARNGVYPVPYQQDGYGLIILSIGAGMALAVADHLLRCYPGLSLSVADMPGFIGFESRCLTIDYIVQAFPTLLIMWNSIRSGRAYPTFLNEKRAFRARCLWVYDMGIDTELSRSDWAGLGARLITNIWQDTPIGNLTPNQIEHPWELMQMENVLDEEYQIQ